MRKIFWLAGAVWLALSLLTLTGYPAVWVDEILSADAGIHLAQGKGFVSSDWFNQPSWEFWASYTPLYAFVLAGWLKIFGISAFAVRSLGLTLVTASLLVVGLFLKRLGNQGWTIIAALALCEPVAFLERAGRPDTVSLFLLCITTLAFIEREWRWRSALLFLLGALAVPAALQYTAAAIILMVLLHIWFKPFARRDLLFWSSGAAAGAAFLALLYTAHGVLKIFIESTLASKHSSAGRLLQNLVLGHSDTPFVFSDIVSAPLRDYATPVVIVAGVLLWWIAKQREEVVARRLSSFGIACGLVIPVAIQLLGKYPIYYAYLGTVPAIIAVLAACTRLEGKVRIIGVVTLALLFAGGVGRFWWKAWQQGEQTSLQPSHISSNDTVVADYPAYYQLTNSIHELFAVGYAGGKVMPHFPPSQAEQVNRLIVRDSMFDILVKKVGGRWRRLGNLTVIRHNQPTQLIFIDDDTRHPEIEPIGIYVRIADN